MLSRTAKYALRATVLIAERGPESPLSVRDMAEELGVPRNYLSKTLHRLAQTGLLVSVRGPGGGFQLAQPPEEIPLRRVVEAVEPPDGAESRCLLGRARCNPDDPCAAHARWCEVTERVDHFFGETMLADITSRVLDRDTVSDD